MTRFFSFYIQKQTSLVAELEDYGPRPDPAQLAWLTTFGAEAAVEQKSLLARYRLLDVLLKKLGELKDSIEETLTARSPRGE